MIPREGITVFKYFWICAALTPLTAVATASATNRDKSWTTEGQETDNGSQMPKKQASASRVSIGAERTGFVRRLFATFC